MGPVSVHVSLNPELLKSRLGKYLQLRFMSILKTRAYGFIRKHRRLTVYVFSKTKVAPFINISTVIDASISSKCVLFSQRKLTV